MRPIKNTKTAVLCTVYLVHSLANAVEGLVRDQRRASWPVFMTSSNKNDAQAHMEAALRWLRNSALVIYNNPAHVKRVKPLLVITDNDGALDKGMCLAMNGME